MLINNKVKIWLVLFFGLNATAFAQDTDTIEVQRNDKSQKITFARFFASVGVPKLSVSNL